MFTRELPRLPEVGGPLDGDRGGLGGCPAFPGPATRVGGGSRRFRREAHDAEIDLRASRAPAGQRIAPKQCSPKARPRRQPVAARDSAAYAPGQRTMNRSSSVRRVGRRSSGPIAVRTIPATAPVWTSVTVGSCMSTSIELNQAYPAFKTLDAEALIALADPESVRHLRRGARRHLPRPHRHQALRQGDRGCVRQPLGRGGRAHRGRRRRPRDPCRARVRPGEGR